MLDCCIMCGCTDDDPCRVHGIPCVRMDDDVDAAGVCSACAGIELTTRTPEGQAWLLEVIEAAKRGDADDFEACRRTAAELALSDG